MLLIGRQHQKQVLFCDCENDGVTLIRLKLWPGSTTRPVLAFYFKLMELAEILLLECHVSLRKFCDAIGVLTKSSTLPTWVSTVLCHLTILFIVSVVGFKFGMLSSLSKVSTTYSILECKNVILTVHWHVKYIVQ